MFVISKTDKEANLWVFKQIEVFFYIKIYMYPIFKVIRIIITPVSEQFNRGEFHHCPKKMNLF